MAEYAYTQNDNEIKVRFQEDGVAKDLTGVTKIAVEFFATSQDPINRVVPVTTLDSVANPTLFDLTDLVNGNLTFKPDTAALTPLKAAKYYGRFVIFSPSYPNGIIWAKTHKDLFEFIVAK